MSKEVVKIGVLGCGTVGTQVVRLLGERGRDLAARAGAPLEIVGICVSNLQAERDEAVDRSLLTTDANSVIDEADLVIELIGGIEPPRTLVRRALSAGKTVVTGNKALLAAHGPELYELAAEKCANLYYEAAVAGAVPVVYGLRESLLGDRINKVTGIVNGTTNYMLEQMDTAGRSYDEALAKAQELGFAEADPTADVDGFDAAAKCAILASLAFHTRVSLQDVPATGIRSITEQDSADAAFFDEKIKLVAVAERVQTEDGEALSLGVYPAVVPQSSALANINGAFNAVVVEAEAAGTLMFTGQGAGGVQTASAVLSDVVAGASHIAHGGSAPRENSYANLPILPASEGCHRYRLRVNAPDELGTLAELAQIFADEGVSISAVHQSANEDKVSVVLSTHKVAQKAIAKIRERLEATGVHVASVLVLEA
ncbi:homoserine dehydrogenase [Winkia sp. UMB10116]|uniref:homoserine dehydrogenase n=1 Tax=Winkia sp. UMB10116 TaxID=3046355 RepID=UPI002555D7C7|nr:homoserine dehydrogenase [Winkia sp. UMB10116]MDK6241794.1 homoserine dehydrogenase [Winkia sp. UMB10116]